jgi:hypothetical protein
MRCIGGWNLQVRRVRFWTPLHEPPALALAPASPSTGAGVSILPRSMDSAAGRYTQSTTEAALSITQTSVIARVRSLTGSRSPRSASRRMRNATSDFCVRACRSGESLSQASSKTSRKRFTVSGSYAPSSKPPHDSSPCMPTSAEKIGQFWRESTASGNFFCAALQHMAAGWVKPANLFRRPEGTQSPLKRFPASLVENKMNDFLRRFLMHYGIYRRYPLGRLPALRNAWRTARP